MKKIFIVIAVSIVVLVGWLIYRQSQPGKYDAFAQCLEDRGTVFYGAFWCSHCQNQKELFGKSAKLLPYVECSTPDGRGKLQICKDKVIEGYPTWEFADGTRLNGEIQLGQLSQQSACPLP